MKLLAMGPQFENYFRVGYLYLVTDMLDLISRGFPNVEVVNPWFLLHMGTGP